MRGEFIGVWSEMWDRVWNVLAEHESASDLFCDLYRELDTSVLKPPTGWEARSLLISDESLCSRAFESALSHAGVDLADGERRALYLSALNEVEELEAGREDTLVRALSRVMRASKSKILWEAAVQEMIDSPREILGLRQRALVESLSSPDTSRERFKRTKTDGITGERVLVKFLEDVHEICAERDDGLAACYFDLLEAFIAKFSLRYDLQRPCGLCPSLAGIFASLVSDLRTVAGKDRHLDAMMKDFEGALRDLRTDCGEGRIKTCIQKQVNLLEAIGRKAPGVKKSTLGAICDQVHTWPHEKIKEAMKNLYAFASDFPGIRHGGTPSNAIRSIDMRDMIAMSILLAGFTPYLTDRLSADVIYRGQ